MKGLFSCNIGTNRRALTYYCVKRQHESEEYEPNQYFYHPDHLGSSSFITNAIGYAEQHMQYLPFGELFVNQQNSTYDTRYKFSAKELDNETGYNYFGQRYLDTELSVWLSVDPLSDKYPSMSPYMYVAGNPVRLVDPNGMSIDDLDGVPDGGDEATKRQTISGANQCSLRSKAGQDNTRSPLKSFGTNNSERFSGFPNNEATPRVQERETTGDVLREANNNKFFQKRGYMFFSSISGRSGRANQPSVPTHDRFPETPLRDLEYDFFFTGNTNPNVSSFKYKYSRQYFRMMQNPSRPSDKTNWHRCTTNDSALKRIYDIGPVWKTITPSGRIDSFINNPDDIIFLPYDTNSIINFNLQLQK